MEFRNEQDEEELARIQAVIDTWRPDERTKAQMAQLSKGWDDLEKLLQRFGFEGPLTWRQLYIAAQSVGVSEDEFARMNLSDVYRLLRVKADVLDSSRRRSKRGPSAPASKALLKAIKIKGGRPAGKPVDAEKLRAYRGVLGLSQEELADKAGVSQDSIRRGEAGERWDERTFVAVALTISLLTGDCVRPKDLRKLK